MGRQISLFATGRDIGTLIEYLKSNDIEADIYCELRKPFLRYEMIQRIDETVGVIYISPHRYRDLIVDCKECIRSDARIRNHMTVCQQLIEINTGHWKLKDGVTHCYPGRIYCQSNYLVDDELRHIPEDIIELYKIMKSHITKNSHKYRMNDKISSWYLYTMNDAQKLLVKYVNGSLSESEKAYYAFDFPDDVIRSIKSCF